MFNVIFPLREACCVSVVSCVGERFCLNVSLGVRRFFFFLDVSSFLKKKQFDLVKSGRDQTCASVFAHEVVAYNGAATACLFSRRWTT